jgi:hypothetical protein
MFLSGSYPEHVATKIGSRRVGFPSSRLAAVLVHARPVEELHPGPGHPRADRADRTANGLSSLLIGEAEELGEDEGFTAVGIEVGEQFLDLQPAPSRCMSEGAWAARRSASLRRRPLRRTASAHTRRAIENSHARAGPSPRNRWRLRIARS